MDLVTKSMSNDLFIPDSPQSVIRTYSKYNGKTLPLGADSPPPSPILHHPHHHHPQTPEHSPVSNRKCVLSSDLRLQALGNSFLQAGQETSREMERGRSRGRDKGEQAFIMGKMESRRSSW